jgi:NAD(P)H-hydrate epimerase
MNDLIKTLIKPRSPASHKGDHGHALLVAGSEGKMGAAVIAARACLRAGAGLLTVCVPQRERQIIQLAIPEAMVLSGETDAIDWNLYSAIGIGPGLGTKEGSKQVLVHVLNKAGGPVVLDADALNIIAADNSLFAHIPNGSVLTPHPKEFDRLFGVHKNGEERMTTAIERARTHSIIIVLKGQGTVVTSGGEAFINTTGNAGLAKGGSGDALTGIITAFAAGGYTPFDAARLGVYIHGLAADKALQKQSLESMLITDVIECLGEAFKETLKHVPLA